jgi:hypothetical protein
MEDMEFLKVMLAEMHVNMNSNQAKVAKQGNAGQNERLPRKDTGRNGSHARQEDGIQ